jgi:CRP-like cAMP-binding protein
MTIISASQDVVSKVALAPFNPLDMFRHEAKFTNLMAGETLFREGDAADFMYVLVRGRASIKVRDHRVEEAQPGALIGELALIDQGLRSATVEAIVDCQLVSIDQRAFDTLIARTPHFARYVMQVMAQRLRRTDALLR